MEGLEKILNIAIAIALSLLFMTVNEFDSKIKNIKSISELNKNQKQIISEVDGLKTLTTQLKTDLNEAKKSQNTVNALAFNSLSVELETHNNRIKELEALYTKNPEKARELFDINQAYLSLEKSVVKIESHQKDLESQLASVTSAILGGFSGLAFTLLGIILGVLISRKKSA